MAAGAVAGERIRALAGDGVPGVAAPGARPEGVRAAGAAGLADMPMLRATCFDHDRIILNQAPAAFDSRLPVRPAGQSR